MKPKPAANACPASSFEEKVDILFNELELAARWDRPSILFTIYRSEPVRDRAMKALEERLRTLDQQVLLMSTGEKDQFDFFQELTSLPDLHKNILFINGFKIQDDRDSVRIFEEINKHREHFIDNSIRAVFWLLEQDVQKFAARAAECWYLRHRVIDLTDEVKPVQIFMNTLESYLKTQASGAEPQEPGPGLKQEIESLSEELDLQPSHASTLYILGLLSARRNDHPNALSLLKASLEIAQTTKDPELQIRCLKALAASQIKLGNIQEAISLYRQAAPLASKPGRIWKNIGLLLSGTREYQATIEAFLNALRHLPQDQQAWICLGNAYRGQGLHEKSISAFETALDLDPDADEALVGVAATCLQMDDCEHAVEALQKAFQLNALNPQAWFYLGLSLERQDKAMDAMSAYLKAVELDPEYFDAWFALGSLHSGRREHRKAVEALEKALHLQPDSGPVFRLLGAAEHALGNYCRAAYLFEQAIPLFDDSQSRAELWNSLAETQLKLSNRDMADSAFRQADRLGQQPAAIKPEIPALQGAGTKNPLENGEVHMMESMRALEARTANEWNDLGNAYLRSGAYKKAIFAFTRAIESAQENNWPYINNLAVANYKMGRKYGQQKPEQPEDLETWDADEDDEDEMLLDSPNDSYPLPERRETPLDAETAAGSQADPAPDISDTAPVARVTVLPLHEENPASADEWNEMGNNYATQGDFDTAIEAYKKAIQIDPEFGQSYSNLGLLYFKKGDYRSAIVLYQKGIEMLKSVEDKAATFNRLGDAYRQSHKYENALLAYKKAEELAPSVNPILNRARYSLIQNSLG